MALSYYSDELIFNTIKQNDSDGCNDVFTFIYQSYYPVIKKLVISNSGNETEAQDIFQETIITFYEQVKRENFELTCSLKTYLYSIGRNLWLKRLSKIKNLNHDINDFGDFISLDDDNEKDSTENGEILLEMIGKLDESCRKILTYFYYDKLRMNVIMNKMKLGSEQSAKNKKLKCMKRLMEVIQLNKKKFMILKENL